MPQHLVERREFTSILRLVVAGCAVILPMDAACGQTYPSKPIRIVTSPAGGGGDFAARLVAQGLSGLIGQQVIVENRPSNLIGEVVFQAPADGYTLAWAGEGFLIGPLLIRAPYDPVTDFSAITMVGRAPSIVVVHPSLPVKSIKDLVALAKARPGVLNYGMGSIGSSNHLGPELFRSMAGVDIVRVNYKGTGQIVTALLGGEIQLTFTNIAGVMPYVKLGKLRALAVTSANPTPLAPGLPTVAASLPGYEISSVDSILGPAKTPTVVISRLNREIVRFLKASEEVNQTFAKNGVEVIGSSPEELEIWMRLQMARVSKVIKDAGIKVE